MKSSKMTIQNFLTLTNAHNNATYYKCYKNVTMKLETEMAIIIAFL